MYEDLIKNLREEAEKRDPCGGNTINQKPYLLMEAADAIEDLQAQLPFSNDAPNAIAEKVPKWISVTERLPKEPYGCLAIVWDNPRYGGGDMFLNYYPEFIGYDGTWNDYDGEEIPLEVAYWMPLPKIPPEPPKEEA